MIIGIIIIVGILLFFSHVYIYNLGKHKGIDIGLSIAKNMIDAITTDMTDVLQNRTEDMP